MKYKKHNQNVKYNVPSFSTIASLWTLVTLSLKLNRILLKWQYAQGKNCVILAAIKPILPKRFRRPRSSGMVCSYAKNFHSVYRGLWAGLSTVHDPSHTSSLFNFFVKVSICWHAYMKSQMNASPAVNSYQDLVCFSPFVWVWHLHIEYKVDLLITFLHFAFVSCPRLFAGTGKGFVFVVV